VIEGKPVVEAELESIDMAIRRERNRLWKLEDEDLDPSYSWLEYLQAEKARGVQIMVVNF
jgi:hypothetical protein